jgi:pSer/pThr/pTyr-binding forkhead associated (FHA) protein
MPLTVLVRSQSKEQARLTFDGTQRVVIGRSAGSDIRLPDASVSHRHATLQAQGADFVVIDEGSTNGTFVGSVRVAPRTSRIVRSGDRVRVGRVELEVSMDSHPVTRDVALATRDLALAMVAKAMDARGDDRVARLRVLEGPDQGAVLALANEGRSYLVGRAGHCDLALSDPDVSREHVAIVLTGGVVRVRDLATKNGTGMGDARVPPGEETVWKSTQMMKIGRTVLALEEPLQDRLALIERAIDELLPEPPASGSIGGASSNPGATAGVPTPTGAVAPADGAVVSPPVASHGFQARWSVFDWLVMMAALGILALSLAGLFWILRSQ